MRQRSPSATRTVRPALLTSTCSSPARPASASLYTRSIPLWPTMSPAPSIGWRVEHRGEHQPPTGSQDAVLTAARLAVGADLQEDGGHGRPLPMDEEQLGGAEMHATRSGLADWMARDEEEALRIVHEAHAKGRRGFRWRIGGGASNGSVGHRLRDMAPRCRGHGGPDSGLPTRPTRGDTHPRRRLVSAL